LVGKIVQHTRYGKGVIREFEHPYMKILFEEMGIEKRFSYPMVFESFLRFEDAECQAQAEEAIAAVRADESRKAEAQSLALRQKEAAMMEAHKAELKAKRAAAAKKAAGTRAANKKASAKT